jgi:hypothetical protein
VLGELQWTLVGVVVLILVAVLIYNRWQERRAKDSINKIFISPTRLDDAALAGTDLDLNQDLDLKVDERAEDLADIEPPWQTPREAEFVQTELSIGDETPWSLETHAESPMAELPHSESLLSKDRATPQGPVTPAAPPAETLAKVASPLNADIEFIIRFPFRLTADRALADMVDRMRSGPDSVRIVGQAEDGGEWQAIDHYSTAVYERAEIGLLLANRKGPTRQDALQNACLLADRYATSHGSAVDYTDVVLAARQAIDLDRFCMEVDQLIDFSVVVPDGFPFSGEALARLVTEQGMQYQSSGGFVMKGETGETLFVLVNRESAPFPANGQGMRTHGVTLMLEVPRCKDGLYAFDRMIGLGDFLADKLSGRVVDSQGRPINTVRLQHDRAALSEACRRLNDRGITPGGEQAQRLFA